MYFEINGKRVLFIHIPKTGGTTVEYTLFEHIDEKFRKLLNYPKDFREGSKITLRRGIKGHNGQHLTLHQIFYKLQLKKPQKIDYIFAIARNPYTRFISEVNWREISPDETIKFIKANPKNPHSRTQRSYINTRKKHKVKIFKYEETLTDILQTVLKKLNSEFVYKESFHQLATKKYTLNDLTPKHIKFIKKYYAKDFETFGYSNDIEALRRNLMR